MTEPPLRITKFVLDVFTIFIDAYNQNKHVRTYELTKPPGGKAGTIRHTLRHGKVTPILMRLENHGWITSDWEPQRPGYEYRRRLYTINPDHAETIRNILNKHNK